MRILDRYLLRQFVKVFFICYFSLTGLYVVIDAFGNLDEFIGYAEKHGSLFSVMGEYYAYRSVAFFDRISGVLALIAAMFTMTWIQRHHEMTAMSAAGIPTSRIVIPVIIAAASISLVAAANRELVLPKIRHVLSSNAQDLNGNVARDVQPRYDNATDVFLRGEKAYTDKQRIHKPHFMLPVGLDQYGKHLVGEDAFYKKRSDGKPGGYLIVNVSQPKEITKKPSLVDAHGPVVITPGDVNWLQPDQVFVVSDVRFEMLEAGVSSLSYSSAAELIRGLGSPSLGFGADVRVAIHGRFLQPALDVTLLLLGLPLVLSHQRRNMYLAIGLCIAVAVLFLLVVIGCHYLGSNLFLNPALAAWLPLFIFVPLAVGLSDPLRR